MHESSSDINTNILPTAEKWADSLGNLLVSLFHRTALFGIDSANVVLRDYVSQHHRKRVLQYPGLTSPVYIFGNRRNGWHLL